MGAFANVNNGEENYEKFFMRSLKRYMVQYDYRHIDGELFSCVKPTLEQCREKRDKWLYERGIKI